MVRPCPPVNPVFSSRPITAWLYYINVMCLQSRYEWTYLTQTIVGMLGKSCLVLSMRAYLLRNVCQSNIRWASSMAISPILPYKASCCCCSNDILFPLYSHSGVTKRIWVSLCCESTLLSIPLSGCEDPRYSAFNPFSLRLCTWSCISDMVGQITTLIFPV